MERFLGLLACVGLCCQAAFAWADALPMVSRVSLLVDRAPLIRKEGAKPRNSPSLFAGRAGGGMFAPAVMRGPTYSSPRHAPLARLRSLIARAEAGSKGYDAVQHGAKIRPDAPPTALTVQDIYDWIDDTPGQPHAIGRYQFIPPTLRMLVQRLNIDPKTRFTPDVQDRLADALLRDAGLIRFLDGSLGREAFMNNLAKIWAGLPNDTGRSHYHGVAGNKATMTWASFNAEMVQIFPDTVAPRTGDG